MVRVLQWLALIVVVVAIGIGLQRWMLAARQAAPAPRDHAILAPAGPSPVIDSSNDCRAEGFSDAAAANERSLDGADWKPFDRDDGWRIYAALVAHEIASDCAPQTEDFARSLSAWQGLKGLPATGRMDAATFLALRHTLELRRGFVRATRDGSCPTPPPAEALVQALPTEGFSGKTVQLLPGALEAYRQMVVAARRESPPVNADHRLLAIVSGFRSPESDAARCAATLDCQTLTRTPCSAHRTGAALDLDVTGDRSRDPTSSAPVNRLADARSPAYLWMVANAGRFGFVNYPYEPWHWEWNGAFPEAPSG